MYEVLTSEVCKSLIRWPFFQLQIYPVAGYQTTARLRNTDYNHAIGWPSLTKLDSTQYYQATSKSGKGSLMLIHDINTHIHTYVSFIITVYHNLLLAPDLRWFQ